MRKHSISNKESKSNLELLKHMIATLNQNFEEYVHSLEPAEKRDFITDIEEIITRTKQQYRNALNFHLFVFILLFIFIINLRLNFSGISALLFIITFGILVPSTIELRKRWKTVRTFKLIKKAIFTLWIGESEIEFDDKEFHTVGTKCRLNSKNKI